MKIERVRADQLRPNTWNPNRMDDATFNATVASLRLHGFVVPIVVRETEPIEIEALQAARERLRGRHLATPLERLARNTLEIVDGEHRWVAAQQIMKDVREGKIEVVEGATYGELGWMVDGAPIPRGKIARQALETFVRDGELYLPVVNAGPISEVEARRLTIALNETRGQSDIQELGKLMADIARVVSVENLEDLPWDPQKIDDIITVAGFEWPGEEEHKEEEKPEEVIEEGGGGGGEEWITMTAEMTLEEYDVWTQAKQLVSDEIEADGRKLHKRDDIANGQVLEMLCADFLAGRRE